MSEVEERPTDRLFTAGVLTAIFFPIAGAIIGVILMAKDDTRGAWVLVGSLLVICGLIALGR